VVVRGFTGSRSDFLGLNKTQLKLTMSLYGDVNWN
jgi:hypothetical protein